MCVFARVYMCTFVCVAVCDREGSQCLCVCVRVHAGRQTVHVFAVPFSGRGGMAIVKHIVATDITYTCRVSILLNDMWLAQVCKLQGINLVEIAVLVQCLSTCVCVVCVCVCRESV